MQQTEEHESVDGLQQNSSLKNQHGLAQSEHKAATARFNKRRQVVLVDPISLQYLRGATIDFIHDAAGERFGSITPMPR